MAPDEKEPVLIAEAFNVAQSFFQGKKSRMLSKLRNKKWINVSEKYLLVNSDAVTEDYSPKLNEGVKILFVDINTGECKEIF